MDIYVGDRFYVSETIEARDNNGRLITKFLPGFGYTATKRNLELIKQVEAAGKVTLQRSMTPEKVATMRAASASAALTGTVSTKK